MLNELVLVERALRQAGLTLPRRHPSIKNVRRMATLVVALDKKGLVASIKPLPREAEGWTIRDGQHNSFPFVQPHIPLWIVPDFDPRRAIAIDRRRPSDERRRALLGLRVAAVLNNKAASDCASSNLLRRLHQRRDLVAALPLDADAQVLWDSMAWFLHACDPAYGGDPVSLIAEVVSRLLTELDQVAQDDWLEVASALLIGRPKGDDWKCDGALLFDAMGGCRPIYHFAVAEAVSAGLSGESGDRPPQTGHRCALTGETTQLVTGNFPQPTLPELGQTWLYAKNREIPANRRYRRVGFEAIAVGERTAMDLQGALTILVEPRRKNVTWRPIPSESQGRDLLLAYVEAVPDMPVVELLTEDDLSMEERGDAGAMSIGLFRERTSRLLATIEGRAYGDPDANHVRIIIIRRVDPANRKVVHAGAPSVGELHRAAVAWADGEANVPPWLVLPVPAKGQRSPRLLSPPHVAPLGLIALSKKLFIRSGTQIQEVVGLPAAEAFSAFLAPISTAGQAAGASTLRWLKLLLVRRTSLVSGTAHILHGPDGPTGMRFNHLEVLLTISLLGVFLHKLSRDWRVYMTGEAFKLGQLLAAADVVHAGYCADVRKGALPPSLLGNQVFAMAQTNPTTALATLCRRWKPYAGWAKQATRERGKTQELITTSGREEQQRGWAIRRAIRFAREMAPLANELGSTLVNCKVDDVFRAELLLGYIAGLPPTDRNSPDEGLSEDHIMNPATYRRSER